MAYIGQQPVVGRYILLDQISGGFNGTTSGFTMSTAGGVQGVKPGLAQNVLLSLGGVIQQPGVDYTISGSGITFTTPPVSGTTFFATVLGDAQSVGTPSDGTVTPASIASGFDFGFPNVNVTGVTTIASGVAATPSLSITGDADTGIFSPAANTVAVTTSGVQRLSIGSSEAVFNDGGNDVDFRVESDGNANMLFVDAGNDRVGVGTGSPENNLHIADTSGPIIRLTNSTGSDGSFTGRISTGDAAGTFFAGINFFKHDTNDGEIRLRTKVNGTNEDTVTVVDGRVGIGESSPAHLLDLSNSSNAYLRQVRGSSTLRIGPAGDQASDGAVIGTDTDSPLRFFTDGSANERLRIDSDGRLLIGTASARSIADGTPNLQVEGTAGTASLGLVRNQNNSGGSNISFAKSRGTSLGANDAVQDNDTLGTINFAGADGTDINSNAASIKAEVDGTPGSNDMPGRLVFSTTADGASSPTERLRIDSSGRLLLGSSTAQTVPTESAFQLTGTDFATSSIRQTRFESGSSGPSIILAHARGTEGSPTILSDNDELGKIRFYAYDGTDFASNGAEIRADVDGTPGENDTPGRLVFSTTADGANTFTERMRIDSSGRLLVGTNSASTAIRAAFQATSGGNGGGAVLISRGTATPTLNQTLGEIYFADSGHAPSAVIAARRDSGTWTSGSSQPTYLRFDTTEDGASSATERMRIDSSGDVLIGTTSNSGGNRLYVVDNFNDAFVNPSDAILRVQNANSSGTSTQASIAFTSQTSSSNADSAIVSQAEDGSGNASLQFWTDSSNGMSEKMRIDSDGRLLVGADSPAVSSLNANIEIRNTSVSEFIFSRNDSTISPNNVLGRFRWYGNDGGTYHEVARLSVAAADSHSNTSKPGQFIFATTATSATTPTERFRIDNLGRIDHFSSDGNGFDLHHAETGSSDIAFQLRKGASNLDDGTACMNILADGDVENTNGRFTQISDIKFKENIVDASSQWEDLKAIRVVNFNFKAEKDWGTHKQIGVVAQEIETVSPGLICQRREENGEEYKSVAYSVLYMKAVKALQEAQTRIETLESQHADLLARVTALES